MFDWFTGYFTQFQTLEERLVATAVVVIVGTAVMAVLAPKGVSRLSQVVRGRVLNREEVPEEVQNYDFVVAVSVVARSLQLVVVVGVLLAVMVVWGFVDVAVRLVQVLGGAAPSAGRIVLTLLLFGAALVGTDVLEQKMEQFAEESTQINRHQQGILFQTVRLSVLIAVGLAVLRIWRVDLSGLLVGAGFLGIIVGLAARQTLGSLIAGFVIMFSRPFELGDWIQIGETEGVVTDITINNTRLRTADGDTVVLPNDQVSNSTVVNHTEQDRLRLAIDVGVDYGTELDRARDLALEAIQECDETLAVPAPQVLPKSFGDSAVVLECRFWIRNPSARTRSLAIAAVVSAVKTTFEREEIKIPFPQRELSGRPETGGLQIGEERRVPDSAVSDED